MRYEENNSLVSPHADIGSLWRQTGCPSVEDTVNEKLTDCGMTISGIHFTKALNGADGQVTDSAGTVTFRAKPHADYFNDPNDGKLSQSNAAVLLTEVENICALFCGMSWNKEAGKICV